MDITFFSAGVGGGKSLAASNLICKELGSTDRHIVTNVAMFVDSPSDEMRSRGYISLQEWCQEHILHPVDVRKRVLLLKDDQLKQFYRYLPGYVMPMHDGLPDLQDRQTKIENKELPFGCLYIIDEVHLIFSARNWQSAGEGVERYMSQARKFNDDLVLISQNPGKVDKNFRRNATRWVYYTNMSKRRLWGGVTLDGRFRFEEFTEEPLRNDKPEREGFVDLKSKGCQFVYNTMAGVGLTSSIHPEVIKKGRHWSVWVVAIIIFLILCVFVPRYVFRVANGAISGAVSMGHKSIPDVVNQVSPSLSLPVVSNSSVSSVVESPKKLQRSNFSGGVITERSLQFNTDIIVNGFVTDGSSTNIYLSNGETYILGDGHLTYWNGKKAIIDGEVFLYYNSVERERFERRQLFSERNKGSIYDKN